MLLLKFSLEMPVCRLFAVKITVFLSKRARLRMIMLKIKNFMEKKKIRRGTEKGNRKIVCQNIVPRR